MKDVRAQFDSGLMRAEVWYDLEDMPGSVHHDHAALMQGAVDLM